MRRFRILLFNSLLLVTAIFFSNVGIADVPYCTAQQLAIHSVAFYVQSMDGTGEAIYGIINRSQTPCFLRGMPKVGITFENEKKLRFVKILCSKDGYLQKSVPNGKNAKNIIVEPYHENDTLKKLVYFKIYFPGGGYSDDNDSPIAAYIQSIKLPGINMPLPLSDYKDDPQHLFIVNSPILKNPKNWFDAIKKDNRSCDISFDKLQTMTLKQIFLTHITCGA